jgi:oligopeptidase B
VIGYEPSDYVQRRLFATASDGTRVPVSIVHRRDLPTGPRPVVLWGYGSYGAPEWPWFDSSVLSLLDRGGIYAIAQLRGGGDYGQYWADDGKLNNKLNTFTDFIAVAEHLIAEKLTAPDRLLIHGASAGGLLVGAVCNMRPDLFKAAVLEVPFVDVLTTMLDDTLPLTTQEYTQWGNPNEREAYFYMKRYSPYDNIERKAYPSMFVKTSLNDNQVLFHEPAKFVAKMRAMRTDDRGILFKCDMDSGHGGASGRSASIDEAAFLWSWMFDQLGLTK